MPLSQQLKSEMTGQPAENLPKPEDEAPAPESENFGEFGDSSSSEAPASDEETTPASETCEPESDQEDLHPSMDDQSTDSSKVIGKTDDAKASLEETLLTKIIDTAEKTEDISRQLMRLLQDIFMKQEYNSKKLMQSLRENAIFQSQVREGMQSDLNELKKQVSGEQFTPILKEIATTYVEFQSILDDETISGPSRKNLRALFEQLEDILSDYGAEVFRSEIGSLRQTKTCKVIEKIPTGQQEKHNTIAKSRKPGVVRDRLVLYPEFVDVFVYDPALTEASESTVEAIEEKGPEGTENSASDHDKLGGNE